MLNRTWVPFHNPREVRDTTAPWGELNIGLAYGPSPTGVKRSELLTLCCKLAGSVFADWTFCVAHSSTGELTLALAGPLKVTLADFMMRTFEAAREGQRDYIALRSIDGRDDHGVLVGPMADRRGEFNSGFFISHMEDFHNVPEPSQIYRQEGAGAV